jgi:predicted DNA-binding transcriptional regulator YafY
MGRDALARRLGVDVRGFYRDLGVLRAAGIDVSLSRGSYRLNGDLSDALSRIPFPDPLLTLGEACLLAKGKTTAHRKLRELLTSAGV